ncbi:MAG: hypothetical protein ACRDQ4_16965 [Pseudonocardiaceae bacterium]
MLHRLAAILDDLTSPQCERWHAIRFQQGDASVSFRADQAEVTQAAIDTLYGYRITQPGRAGWDITVYAAAVLDTAVLTEVFTDAPLRETGPRLHALALSSSRGQTYWVVEHATIVHADHATATITAYCTGVEPARYWAVRLVRQAMTGQLLAAGAVYAHAAAFSYRGRGVLVTGHKGAGKTTTLVTSLRLIGGDYVTNDRLLLRREGGELVGRPWPMHIRVGVGTLLTLPDLADLVPADLRDLPAHRRWRHPDKVAIEPPDFARLLAGGVVVSEVRPRLMLWPYLSSGGNSAAPAAVSAAEAHDVLLATRLFMLDPASGASSRVNHWLIGTPPDAQTAENLRQVVEDLAVTVPCYRMPVDGDPAALAVRISELLAHIPPVTGP